MTTLLQAGDPPPFEILNPTGRSECVLVCEHAGALVPSALGNMGLDDDDFTRHYALDIGVRGVTEYLAGLLDATAVVANYSRLVVDINRTTDHATTFPESGEGKSIPGNIGITDADKAARLDEIYHPFDRAVTGVIDGVLARGGRPMVLSVHSYTPIFFGVARPWEFAVLWREDWPMSRALVNYFNGLGVNVGDNEPYDARKQCHGTLDRVAGTRNLPHALIEIRNNLILNEEDQKLWAQRLADAMGEIMADEMNRSLPLGRKPG